MANAKFIPSERSLFLTSISDAQIRSIAASALKIPSGLQATTSDGKFSSHINARIKIAMDILEKSIFAEQGVEQNFFTRLLQGSKLSPDIRSALQSQLNTVKPGSNTGFNYENFLAIINKILLGTEQYKEILQLESQRLNDLTNIYNNIASEIAGIKPDPLDSSTEVSVDANQLLAAAKEKIKNIYLERHSMSRSDYSRYFSKVLPTIDYLLAQAMNEAANTLMTSSSSQLLGAIKNNDSYHSMTENIRNILITSTARVAREHINADNMNKANLANKIALDVMSQFDNVSLDSVSTPELSGTFGITNTSVHIIDRKIKDGDETQQEYEVRGKKLTDSILRILPLLDANEQKKQDNTLLLNILNDKAFKISTPYETKQILDVLKNIRADLAELVEAQKRMDKFNKNQKLTRQQYKELQSAEQLVNELKERIRARKSVVSKQLAERIQTLINEQASTMQDEYVRQLEACFDQGSINITGPELSEIIEKAVFQLIGSNGDVRQFQTGQANTKADTIIIQIKPTYSSTEMQPSNAFNEGIHQATRDIIPKFYSDFQTGIKRSKDESFSLKKGATAWYEAIHEATQTLQSKIENLQKIDQSKDITDLTSLMSELKNSIVVTTTMKTFNQYNNDIGFISGSLGANISAQIDNFSTLFEAAGAGKFTDEEVKTLEVLLVNCSSAAMGAMNKDPLEKMLSVLAAFAVFDEGSAELEMIAGQAVSEYAQYSPKIMHLYKLNGLYFSGSYVLQRIKDHLTQMSQVTENSMNKIVNNDGAVIRAVADESVIPKQGTPQEKWTQAFSTALSSEYTSISVTFLSGLLDVVNQLSGAMNPR